ncbi:unnamed protein product [Effrenium voratum]|nr:unnamed protein product [Effrenium voratum]
MEPARLPPLRCLTWHGISATQARPDRPGFRPGRGCLLAVPLLQRLALRRQSTRLRAEKAEQPRKEEKEKSLEEKFNDFTTVLPWFGFAEDLQRLHLDRRTQRREETPTERPADRASLAKALSEAAVDCEEMPEVVEAVIQHAESGAKTEPTKVIDALCGRWEAVWSGAFTPLSKVGLPKQCLWVEVSAEGASPPVVTAHSGVPLLFGAYLWTSCAGDLLPAENSGNISQVLIQFSRYWVDIGGRPRGDVGRIDGGYVQNRLEAFGAALVTPVLLEFGALKWLLERFGFQKVFEVEVPKDDGKTVKLQASLELYLTLLARVAFPDSLSTCPVPFLDTDRGLCVYEIPMLGPLADLPFVGGNAAALVARKLPEAQDFEHPLR